MNCKFTNVLVFAVGAAIGSAVTWKVLKDKYERIVQEEIESVKDAFNDRLENRQEQVDDYSTSDAAEEWNDRAQKIDWLELEDLDELAENDEEEYRPDDYDMAEYARLTDNYTSEKGGVRNMTKAPYVISPDDFGELDEFKRISLTYYADDTLEDDEGNVLSKSDIKELIGTKALTTFGEYEDDSVFVRNERLGVDFEILKDYRTYEAANSIGPGRVGDE